MKRPSLGSALVAASVGVFYAWVVAQFWAMYSSGSPIGQWLRVTLPPVDHPLLHQIVITLHDAILNVLLAVPFAAIFLLFRQLRHRQNLLVAVCAAIALAYGGAEWDGVRILIRHPSFWIGVGMLALSLPLAFLLLRALRNQWTHD